jgi:hypothetical protein
MTKVTVVEVARMCNIKIRSARAKLCELAKKGKATQLNPKVSPNNPAVYELHIPLKNLLMDQSEAQVVHNGNTNYKRFCADPFNLGKGARG